jgi:acetylornithine deacetylase/succinyl-diaminopimelate desuccinylase-like protein
VDAEVIVRGPCTDLHSGAYGGVIHNPIHLVGQIIAALHDTDGRVRIPGFYADVRPLLPAERALIASFEPMLLERARKETGLSTFWGESLATYGERATAQPTCDVNGIWGGYQGPGSKTVIPAQAGFKVSMRVVPGQNPRVIMQLFSAYVASFAVDTLQIEVRPGATNWPATLLYDGPVLDVLQQTYITTWGKPAHVYRAGGCVPLLGLIQQTLGTPLLDLGFGVGENSHAPNEYLVLDYFQRGIETAIHFYHGLAAVSRAEIHA